MTAKKPDFSSKFDRSTMKTDPTKINLPPDTEKEPTQTPSPATNEPSVKRKPGRPKIRTEAVKTINIAVPISLLEKMEVAKVKHSGNLTAYVNHLIEQDLDAHYDDYLKLKKMMES